MRLLVKEVEALREAAERVKSLEVDNRELCKQAAIDQKTLSTLREVKRTNRLISCSHPRFRFKTKIGIFCACVQELVNEKLRSQQRENEVEKLNHQLETLIQNQDHKTTLETSDQG